MLKPEPSLTAGAAAQGHDQVVVFVKDNGVGSNVEYLNKLFCVMQCLYPQEAFIKKGTRWRVTGLASVYA
jgi:light-regulated signal transduction histidine kinase (bacteriophytochrome)